MFTIYNEIASVYNHLRALVWRQANIDFQDLNEADRENALLPIWQELEANRPYGFDSFSCSDGIALWLYDTLSDDFYFISAGIKTEQKNRLSTALKYLALSQNDLDVVSTLNKFASFLDRYPIVFPN